MPVRYLDSRPLTNEETAEVGAFLAAHNLPLLEGVPVVGRMLLDDMRRIRNNKSTRYIIPPAGQREPERISVMRNLWFVGWTCEEIGKRFSLDEKRVGQLIGITPRKLRSAASEAGEDQTR